MWVYMIQIWQNLDNYLIWVVGIWVIVSFFLLLNIFKVFRNKTFEIQQVM